MRAHQVFAAMSPERAVALMETLREQAPLAFAQASNLTATATS